MLGPCEVLALIREQAAQQWLRSDWPHGVTIARCLVDPPQRRVFIDAADMKTEIELWVVLEEDPEGHSGYCVAFDDSNLTFGLATDNLNGPPVFLGYYGSLADTLEAM